MRAAIGKVLRKEFEQRLLARLPCFEKAPLKDNPLGERAYRCRVAPDLTFFILLQPQRREEGFTIEIGWSTGRRWPFATAPWSDPTKPLRGAAGWFNIGAFWNAPNSLHVWKLAERVPMDFILSSTPDQILDRLRDETYVDTGVANVPAAVEDAITRIVKHALPYFRNTARKRRREFSA